MFSVSCGFLCCVVFVHSNASMWNCRTKKCVSFAEVFVVEVCAFLFKVLSVCRFGCAWI